MYYKAPPAGLLTGESPPTSASTTTAGWRYGTTAPGRSQVCVVGLVRHSKFAGVLSTMHMFVRLWVMRACWLACTGTQPGLPLQPSTLSKPQPLPNLLGSTCLFNTLPCYSQGPWSTTQLASTGHGSTPSRQRDRFPGTTGTQSTRPPSNPQALLSHLHGPLRTTLCRVWM